MFVVVQSRRAITVFIGEYITFLRHLFALLPPQNKNLSAFNNELVNILFGRAYLPPSAACLINASTELDRVFYDLDSV